MAPGASLETMTEAAGPATTTKAIELNVDCSASIVNDNGTTRKITKEEVIFALNEFHQYIMRSNWPPV
jgi:hypothetical protein